MNTWFRDARCKAGQAKAIAAEDVEREGNFEAASGLYLEAAEAFASVAIEVPADHPNTRSDLAIAAVVSFARGGDPARAVGLARRMLAEREALSEHGELELERMAHDYAEPDTDELPRPRRRESDHPAHKS